LSVGGIVFELQREQFQCEFVEFYVLRLRRHSEAKAGGELRKFFIHAVFVCRLVFRYSRWRG
jgi:hypothetical protein